MREAEMKNPKHRSLSSLALLLASLASLAAHAASPTRSTLTYHEDAARRGAFVVPALDFRRARRLHRERAFQPRLSGRIYAQPLYWRGASGRGKLLVATEKDWVYALDAASGKVLWERRLGHPVSLDSLPCGNIDPVGITGTPVIDAAHRAVYLDAMVRGPRTGAPTHELFALSLANGSTLAGWPVDVGSLLGRRGLEFRARTQNERGALLVLGERVYVPYGGNFGDCGRYHGWVVGVRLDDPRRAVSWHTSAQAGGVWAPGGISAADGHLYFATGNTMGARGWGGGEAVLRLPPSLAFPGGPTGFFAPRDWRRLDRADLDLGGVAPVLFDLGAARYALALGKNGKAYLLDRRRLGGIGGSLASGRVASTRIITAPAQYPAPAGAMIAFEARGNECPAGAAHGDLTVIAITPGAHPKLRTAWCGAVRGRGTPIVTSTDGRHDPIVWVLGAQGDERLHGFRGDDGRPLFVSGPLPGLAEFATPIVTQHHLYVGADNTVIAFEF
jgi:hypothetical protein